MKHCVICNGEPKYKCPICLVYYCSVACCKEHRTQNCEVASTTEEKPSTSKKSEDDYHTPDTVPLEALEQLRGSEEVKESLSNPHLRELLKDIDSCSNPSEAMEKAMLEPIFVEFADACLKVVEPNTQKE